MFCSILQGSVLGLLLFTLYTLSSLIYSHKLDHHLYADNTQVYCISLFTSEVDLSLTQLDDYFSDIFGWMTNNRLRLNAEKQISLL